MFALPTELRRNTLSVSPVWVIGVYKLKQLNLVDLAVCVGDELSSRSVARQVLSPQQSLTSVFGMGTGGPSAKKHQLYLTDLHKFCKARRKIASQATA